MKRVMPCFFLLLITGCPAAFAQDQAAKPLPDIVQKMMAALKHKQTLSVAVNQTDDSAEARPDSGFLEVSLPNKIKLMSRVQGLLIATMVSDGKTMYQWDDSLYVKREAPASLSEFHRILPFGASAIIAQEMFTKPEMIEKITDWSDTSSDTIRHIPARKVSAPSQHLTLWLESDSGLPLQESLIYGDRTVTFSFAYTGIGGPVTDADFKTLPPDDLTLYAPPHEGGLQPGTPAPDFTLSTLDGQAVTLSQLHGKYVLVDFWASWCPPCQASMPHIQQIYTDLKQRGLTVLSVNTSDERDKMEAFLAKHLEYTTTMLFDPNGKPLAIASAYQVKSIPTVYVIDKDGNIVASFVGYGNNEESRVRLALSYAGI